MRSSGRGVTLIELIVVLVLMALTGSVVGLALRSTAAGEPRTWGEDVSEARDSALKSGHPLTVQIRGSERVDGITVLPDGRVIADSALAVDRLSGDSDAVR